MKINENREAIARILKTSRTIAVVGLSRDPEKDSHRVASYLQTNGYRIIPVNPAADEILGEKVYKKLSEIPFQVDLVDIFRPAGDVASFVDEAIEIGARSVWMQNGIINEEAAIEAGKAGLDVVMDRCMMTEHRRFRSMWI